MRMCPSATRQTRIVQRSTASRGLAAFRTRFGIRTGPAVVGNVGPKDRVQYTGMGDTVNVASRLEGLNKTFNTTILVSGSVQRHCHGGLFCAPLVAES